MFACTYVCIPVQKKALYSSTEEPIPVQKNSSSVLEYKHITTYKNMQSTVIINQSINHD